jgi:hypothetical protein
MPETPQAPIGRYRWVVCSLLFLATTINYIDIAFAIHHLLAPRLEPFERRIARA